MSKWHQLLGSLKTKNAISLLFFAPLLSLAGPDLNGEVEYSNSLIHFRAVKSKNGIMISDHFGPRTLDIKACNEKIVEKFWNALLANVRSVRGTTFLKNRKPSSSLWIKYEGIQFHLLGFEPSILFFNDVPFHSLVLFSESKRLCRK